MCAACGRTDETASAPQEKIRLAPENLEDDDLLEMVNAGLLPAIVVDNYLAAFWKNVFTNVTVHDKVAVRTGGTLAVAIRKNSPQALKTLDTFIAKHGLGTTFGNVVEREYLVSMGATPSPSPRPCARRRCPRQGARQLAGAARPSAVPLLPGEPRTHAYHPCDDEPPRRPWSRRAPAEDRRWPARRPDS